MIGGAQLRIILDISGYPVENSRDLFGVGLAVLGEFQRLGLGLGRFLKISMGCGYSPYSLEVADFSRELGNELVRPVIVIPGSLFRFCTHMLTGVERIIQLDHILSVAALQRDAVLPLAQIGVFT